MKAILVIDLMPKTCKECKYYDDYFCRIQKWCPEDDLGEDGKATWCPLKPLPQYEDVGEVERLAEEVGDRKECAVAYADGYNDCINDILGYQDESNTCD